jgi:hypothetical protein
MTCLGAKKSTPTTFAAVVGNISHQKRQISFLPMFQIITSDTAWSTQAIIVYITMQNTAARPRIDNQDTFHISYSRLNFNTI